MARIAHVLVFVVAYVAWAYASFWSAKTPDRSHSTGQWLMRREFNLLVTNVGFFIYLYVVLGLWNLPLLIFFVAAAHLGLIVGFVLTGLLGLDVDNCAARSFGAGVELSLSHPKWIMPSVVLTALLSLCYLVIGGIASYRYAWTPAALLFLPYTVLVVIVGPLPQQIALATALLTSEDLEDETREYAAIEQLVTLVPTALYIVLAIWAFGLGPGGTLALPMIARTLPVRLSMLVVLFLASLVIIPYAIGTQRAKRKKLKLLRARIAHLAALLDILGEPIADHYLARLQDLPSQLQKAGSLVGNRPMLQLAEIPMEQQAETMPQIMKPILAEPSRYLGEQRTSFIGFIESYQQELDDLIRDLQSHEAAEMVHRAGLWSVRYAGKKQELESETAVVQKSSPKALVLLGTAAAGLVSPVISGVGTTVWNWISAAGRVGSR